MNARVKLPWHMGGLAGAATLMIYALVAVGFTGAYTTFSTFEYESHGLLKDGDGLAGMTYVFLSVFLGLLAIRCGIFLARWR